MAWDGRDKYLLKTKSYILVSLHVSRLFKKKIYFREGEREYAHTRVGAGAERETESQGDSPPSVEPDAGLSPTTQEIMI